MLELGITKGKRTQRLVVRRKVGWSRAESECQVGLGFSFNAVPLYLTDVLFAERRKVSEGDRSGNGG